ADAVLLAQQRHHLLVEDLERGAARLLDDGAAVLDVGVVAEVGALVHEALPAQVHDDAERVRVLLKVVTDLAVAVPGRVEIPLHRVAAAPVAPRQRADVERHPDAVPRVVRRPSHARQLPVAAEIPRAHLGVGLESAGGEARAARRASRTLVRRASLARGTATGPAPSPTREGPPPAHPPTAAGGRPPTARRRTAPGRTATPGRPPVKSRLRAPDSSGS